MHCSRSVRSSSLILLALAVLGFAFAPQIIAVFRGDKAGDRKRDALQPQRQRTDADNLGIVAPKYRNDLRASIVAAARQGLFFVPFALVLPHFFGLTGVQLCQAASDLCAFILSICVTVPVVRQLSEGKNPHDAL